MEKKSPAPTDNGTSDISKNKGIFRRWEVVSTEYSVNEYGNRIVSKETHQLRREFWLKIISSSAVIIAFAGLVLNLWYQRKQNDFQIAQQRALAQFAIYTKCMANLNILATGQEIDSAFLKSERALEFENYPQIMLLGNDKLSGKFDDLMNLVYFYEKIHLIQDTTQTIADMEISTDVRIESFTEAEYDELKKSSQKMADFDAETRRDYDIFERRSDYLFKSFREIDSDKMNAALKLLPSRKEITRNLKFIRNTSSSISAGYPQASYDYVWFKKDYYGTNDSKYIDWLRGKSKWMVTAENATRASVDTLNKILDSCRTGLRQNRKSILELMIKTNLILKGN
jgi:hypothetical protein